MPETRASWPRLRIATAADAEALAELHAESWRRHYRGAYSDAFLDGDVAVERLAVWSERLREPDPRRCTIVAEDDRIVGFANTTFEDDPAWGALLENLHVADGHKRRGIASRLLAMTARAVLAHRRRCGPYGSGMYVWVLEQNAGALAFYEALGATRVGRAPVSPPGGIASRLTGSPAKLRYAWEGRPLRQLVDRASVASADASSAV